jgi:hypothetical protein
MPGIGWCARSGRSSRPAWRRWSSRPLPAARVLVDGAAQRGCCQYQCLLQCAEPWPGTHVHLGSRRFGVGAERWTRMGLGLIALANQFGFLPVTSISFAERGWLLRAPATTRRLWRALAKKETPPYGCGRRNLLLRDRSPAGWLENVDFTDFVTVNASKLLLYPLAPLGLECACCYY